MTKAASQTRGWALRSDLSRDELSKLRAIIDHLEKTVNVLSGGCFLLSKLAVTDATDAQAILDIASERLADGLDRLHEACEPEPEAAAA
jgi:hypothetical protein